MKVLEITQIIQTGSLGNIWVVEIIQKYHKYFS